MKAKPPKKPVKDISVKPDKRAKSQAVGNGERVAERKKAVMEKRRSGLNSSQIGSDLGLSSQSVCNIMADARKELAAYTNKVTKEVRNHEAESYIGLINTWIPLALQPYIKKKATLEEQAQGKKDEVVFNPAALDAFNAVLKAKAQYARLFGLNMESPEGLEPQLTKAQTLVWISNQIVFEKPREKGMIERFGLLEIDNEPQS